VTRQYGKLALLLEKVAAGFDTLGNCHDEFAAAFRQFIFGRLL